MRTIQSFFPHNPKGFEQEKLSTKINGFKALIYTFLLNIELFSIPGVFRIPGSFFNFPVPSLIFVNSIDSGII